MQVLVYWLGIRLYALAVRVASLFNHKAGQFIKGRKGLDEQIRYAMSNERRPRIWVHCASLGEFEQGRPLLEALRKQYNSHALVLTFFSPSGYEVRKNYDGVDYVFYLPLDSARQAANFVKSVRPQLAIFVKYELWYFLLRRLQATNIPALLVSAIFRDSQSYFKWYGGLHRKMLGFFQHIFVQDERSVNMLEKLGITHASMAGDTRFDRVAPLALNPPPAKFMDTFCMGSKVIVAGSTWEEDEELIKKVFDKLPRNWKLVIVPHEIHLSHMKQLMETYEGDAVLWSRFDADHYDQRVLLVDTVGVLIKLYQYADIAYVGGGFNKSGIHNILEAAVYAKPVFHGPEYQKFKEAVELKQTGSAIPVQKADAMYQQIMSWETDRISYNAACLSAKKYVVNNTGATDRIMRYIEEKALLTNS